MSDDKPKGQIEQEFDRFITICFPKGVTADDRRRIRDIFFSGAVATCGVIQGEDKELKTKLDAQRLLRTLVEVSRELAEFCDEKAVKAQNENKRN